MVSHRFKLVLFWKADLKNTPQEGPRSRTPSEEAPNNPASNPSHDYDRDLIAVLPPFHIVDALLEYYFEYCNWVYRHVNQAAFLPAWQKFKAGSSPSRLTFATAAVLSALAIRYLPPGHELLSSLPTAFSSESCYDELSTQYYNTMKTALQRYKDEDNFYTLDLVELLLVRSHYLTFTKTSPEEIWSVRGELVTVGTAMGLHRDPGRTRYSKDAAERRRWAWWHIILLERSVVSVGAAVCIGLLLLPLEDGKHSCSVVLSLSPPTISTRNCPPIVHLNSIEPEGFMCRILPCSALPSFSEK